MSQAPHSTLNAETLCQISEDILALARKQGASAAEAAASTGKGLSVTVRLGEVESIEYNQDKGMGVTVYLGQSKGSASTSDFSRKAIAETVEAALTIARHTAADPFSGLADPALFAREFPDLDLYHPWSIDADTAADLARRCEAATGTVIPVFTIPRGAVWVAVKGYRCMPIVWVLSDSDNHPGIACLAPSLPKTCKAACKETTGTMWHAMLLLWTVRKVSAKPLQSGPCGV